jgi:hypothetical protein
MPDADDFDVDYFRTLLKGPGPKEKPAPPEEPPVSAPKKKLQPAAKPAAAKPKSKPAASEKKSRR